MSPPVPRSADPLLPPEVVGQLTRFRLTARRRVQGRFAGVHPSRRHGASMDFADHREYVPGDDPRRVDRAAWLRLGRLLVRLYEAEDEAAVRIVLDLSASMGFGAKLHTARQVVAALTVLAAGGQDRVRVVLAGAGGRVDSGPWFRGLGALTAVEQRLLAAAPPDGAHGRGDAPGAPDLAAALQAARRAGPTGPVVLVSDLAFDGWQEVVRAAASGPGDALAVHVVGRSDLEPDVRGDLRLVDAETGEEIEVGIAEAALASYRAACDRWLDAVERLCGQQGVTYARLVDDQPVGELVTTTLRSLGMVT